MTQIGTIPFPLSKPVSDIPTGTVFDVVVIGSGYGGAVVAYRCAAFGNNVALLERGAETAPTVWGDPTGYPNTLQAINAAMEIETDSGSFGTKGGLFDLRVGEDVSVLVGCGLGGGSLINASVALRAHKKVLSGPAWPQVFQDNPDLLTPYYELAETCLGSNPYPSEQTVGEIAYPALNKVAALKEAAKAVDKPFEMLPINVTFAAGPNHFGFYQNPCVLCGDCMTGCNYGAKNTTLMNYLPAAAGVKNTPAQIFTGAEVDSIEQLSSGVWQVYLTVGSITVQAKRVVLAAGSLGSTEILLRSRTKRNLQISPKLGSRFSTNGDFLAFGYDTDWRADGVAAELLQDGDARLPIHGVGAGNRLDPGELGFSSDAALRPGPSTAGVIKCDDDLDVANELIIEEGTLPSAFNMVIPPLQFLGSALKGDFFQYADSAQRLQDAQALGTAIQNDVANIADEAYRGPVSRTQMYLVMSHDDSGGSLTLDATTQKARVNWLGAGSERAFSHEDRTLAKVNEALRGTMLHDPLWSDALGRQLITVHPLGGCPMADSGANGVVNHAGQVFVETDSTTYDSLWVCDGSIIPTSLGVNPLLTITALAERIACLMTRGAANCPPPNDAAASIGQAVSRAAAAQPPAGAAEVSALVTTIQPGTISNILSVLLSSNTANPEGSPPFTIAANAAAAAALQTLLQSTGQLLDPTTQGNVSAALQKNQLATIQSDVMTTILKPLDESAVAWSASDNPDPNLWNAVEAQFEKLVQRLPIGFTPAFSFSERMHGWISVDPLPHPRNDGTNIANPYEVASGYGEYWQHSMGSGNQLIVDLQISTGDLNALATTPGHSAAVSGKLASAALTHSDPPIPVTGTLALLITDAERVETCQMIYDLQGTTTDGRPVKFHGVKYLQRRPGSSPWSDLTTLYTTVTVTDPKTQQQTVWRGVLRLNLQDAIALASTATPSQPTGGIIATLANGLSKYPTAAAKLTDMVNLFFVAQFAGFFSQAVFRIYGGLLADLENFAAQDNRLRQHRPLNPPTPTPEVHPLRTPDGFDLQLTRYKPVQTAPKKPVILAPGFLTSAASFATDTVTTNVVEFLNGMGYDVWLFDYRGSPALPAGRAFTVDDIAAYDWPSAIDYVCAVAGVPQVRVLAHCVGSLSFLMALLREPAQNGVAPAICQQIKSAVCSQLTLHPVTNWLNYLKVDLDVLGVLEKTFHLSSLDLVSTKTMTSEMLDAWLWSVPVPPGEECVNPLCHRVFSVFGPSWAHKQLNSDTHNALLEWFGTVPAQALEQLTTIMKEGKAVDHKGHDVYLPNVANLSNVPITFLAGELNQIFTPESSVITLQWLREKLPGSAAKYKRRVFPGYAHMDHWIGKNAAKDIFPCLPGMLDP